ncbi:MAG: glycosyltransferase family 4 protein [Candidatus Omnitrophica bacterium]|nr:glycosyltransferase family 4 protein [Candidatus Omnitrophota bacterium]
MLKICIWMNIPSHYQSAFFEALDEQDNVDLQVRYFSRTSQSRVAEGWNSSHEIKSFESFTTNSREPEALLETLPDWKTRVHIINSHFSQGLIDLFCAEKVNWCHWSELPGIRLAELLGYRMHLYRTLAPLMLILKRKEGAKIASYALGAFGQGVLARKSFQAMGVKAHKSTDLFYVPDALPAMEPCEQILKFANGRKVFLAVGALCKRKGIDVLLKAFAGLKAEEWCLVLCGLDKANGQYEYLAERLGIREQINFLGAYPSDRIAEVYAAADVFILASRFDGWGAVLNEAASIGLPLIGTDLCGAAWHVIEDGKNGYRVKAGSVQELTDKIRIYIETPHITREQGRYSKELFFREFTPERNAQRLVKALNEWKVGCG